MEHIKITQRLLNSALQSDQSSNLLARANAWSSMRENGVMPNDTPAEISKGIETELAEFGFLILKLSLSCKERGGDPAIFTNGFHTAGRVFEALTKNSGADFLENDFYKIVSASCYHISGYSAMAYSVINYPDANNLTAIEFALRLLILRDIRQLKVYLEEQLTNPKFADEEIVRSAEQGELDHDELISVIINISGCRVLANFEFALQTGDVSLLETSKNILVKTIKLAVDSNNVPHYWVLRLISSLIDDLWESSLHRNLPVDLHTEKENDYPELRELFLATLYQRRNAEVELWPSQLEAAQRALDLSDDLVVALPTSAGKTRIAELTGLMTLSTKKRILIVTPLRALSAQTERSFRETFAPLGFKVSSLYGASGSNGDEDAIRTNDIVISTPEKLDFALRSDPTIIDDVGLVVLDEGHLIGKSEREIKFEILVQKLLKRNDADVRRIVCLSAILPSGDPLRDLTLWIRKDKEGSPVSKPWRPTRQRFGTISATKEGAKLNYGREEHEGFIPRFIEIDPIKDNLKLRSRNLKDITMTSAWKFAKSGKRVLVFVTQANWVEGFGRVAQDLVKNGFLPTLAPKEGDIRRAVEIGKEWLGAKHPAVVALQIGIGIHHGKLPPPFLRELELLLSEGKILITVASPTLSQGLNINAAILLVPYLYRSGSIIEGEEFANVVGRAGRAFVDVEGLVFHIIPDNHFRRKTEWFRLIRSARYRELESGMLQVVNEVILALSKTGIFDQQNAFEYLANNIDAWKSDSFGQELLFESPKVLAPEQRNLEMLDAMVLGLIEALETDSSNLPQLLDEALKSSLWERQMLNKNAENAELHRNILIARARLIWKNTSPQTRRGHFAMGVGLEAGLMIDSLAHQLSNSLDSADEAAITNDLDSLIKYTVSIAEIILSISPFKGGEEMPENWRDLLSLWLSGATIDVIGAEYMPFIESVFVYKLVWAFESLRIRRISFGWKPESWSGMAAACIETGTYRYQAALLIRAGLPSRIAATAAITSVDSAFLNKRELRDWLRSIQIEELTRSGIWPTPKTSELWTKFRIDFLKQGKTKLRIDNINDQVLDTPNDNLADGLYRLISREEGVCELRTADFELVGVLAKRILKGDLGHVYVRAENGGSHLKIRRVGPGKIVWGK